MDQLPLVFVNVRTGKFSAKSRKITFCRAKSIGVLMNSSNISSDNLNYNKFMLINC